MIYCLSEVKKLLREKLFAIFIVLCLCLNIGLCFSDSGTRTAVNRMAQSGELLEGKRQSMKNYSSRLTCSLRKMQIYPILPGKLRLPSMKHCLFIS